MLRAAYQFCPYDGSPLETLPDDHGMERPHCPACDFIDYANPKPCAGAMIVSDGKLLLARRALEPFKGMWDLPGGFVEAGESAEQAAVREILEETHLHIRITGYVDSIPDAYGDSPITTLNIYYVAEVINGELEPASDVAELKWFPLDALPTEWAFPHQTPVIAKFLQGPYISQSER
jgi:ADP-ribose pyrophosphatase YjhB (NUDIX family)